MLINITNILKNQFLIGNAWQTIVFYAILAVLVYITLMQLKEHDEQHNVNNG